MLLYLILTLLYVLKNEGLLIINCFCTLQETNLILEILCISITLIVSIAAYLIPKREPTIREILTSEKLVVTKLIPLRVKLKKTKQEFEAELRDVFKVIKYDSDSSYGELDWTLCPSGRCPEMGQFKEGTLGYKKIDNLIRSVHSKQSNHTK